MASDDDTNIWIAAGDGDLKAVQDFVAGGVSVSAQDETGYSPAHAAASYGRVDVLRWLLQNGADASLGDSDGDTPLHACESATCAELLVRAGAALDPENNDGVTPYALAVEDNRKDMVDWFVVTYALRGMTLPHVEAPADGDDDNESDEDNLSESGDVGNAAAASECADEPASKRVRQ